MMLLWSFFIASLCKYFSSHCLFQTIDNDHMSKLIYVCKKAAAKAEHQQIDQLQHSPPYTNTSMDFAGPFWLKKGNTQKPTIVKSYLVCFSTEATHLELVSDLSTTEAFLAAALKQFTAR